MSYSTCFITCVYVCMYVCNLLLRLCLHTCIHLGFVRYCTFYLGGSLKNVQLILLSLIFLTISDFKLELSDNFQIICYLCLCVKSTILLFVLHWSHLFFPPPSFPAFFGFSIFIAFYFPYKFLSYISCFVFFGVAIRLQYTLLMYCILH